MNVPSLIFYFCSFAIFPILQFFWSMSINLFSIFKLFNALLFSYSISMNTALISVASGDLFYSLEFVIFSNLCDFG